MALDSDWIKERGKFEALISVTMPAISGGQLAAVDQNHVVEIKKKK